MTSSILHRGPDADGHWHDSEAGIHIGHRRLSILDLSEFGAQPMLSPNGSWVLSYNGEVYNTDELAKQLSQAGYSFRGTSDTEVLVAAIEHWGPGAVAGRLRGIFAFAAWSRADKELWLFRDQLGVKPLYWTVINKTLLFSSEMRAFRHFPSFRTKVDRDAVGLLLRHNCIPAPNCVYEGVHKLQPGHFLRVVPGGRVSSPEPYFSLTAVAMEAIPARARNDSRSRPELVESMNGLLSRVVREQMVSDVPLGAFLSGGIDSSLVVALMQSQSSRRVQTFTVGFTDPRHDESRYARDVAEHLGTSHTQITLTEADALEVIPELATIYDEPFSDSSQIPTLLVSRLARQSVTVALSGDGGDELFGGYNRHIFAPKLWALMRRLPLRVRRRLQSYLQSFSPGVLQRLGSIARLSRRQIDGRGIGQKLSKAVSLLDARTEVEMYQRLQTHWSDLSATVPGFEEPWTVLGSLGEFPTGLTSAESMMLLDALSFLPDDILVKVDRASMSTGLEVRVPLLDVDVVSAAWQIPVGHKIAHGSGKAILKDVLALHVPRELFERPKMGFSIPLDRWLRGPLRAWAESLLTKERFDEHGLFARSAVMRLWTEHQDGLQDRHYELWDVLMFQSWYQGQK